MYFCTLAVTIAPSVDPEGGGAAYLTDEAPYAILAPVKHQAGARCLAVKLEELGHRLTELRETTVRDAFD